MKLSNKLFTMAAGFSGVWTLCFMLSDKVAGESVILVGVIVTFLIASGIFSAMGNINDT